MQTEKIKSFHKNGSEYEKSVIENAVLDRVKREWKSLPEITKKQVLTLAKLHNRFNEFSND